LQYAGFRVYKLNSQAYFSVPQLAIGLRIGLQSEPGVVLGLVSESIEGKSELPAEIVRAELVMIENLET